MNELNLQNSRFNELIISLDQYPNDNAIFVCLELPIQEGLAKYMPLDYENTVLFDLITTDNFFSQRQIWYKNMTSSHPFTSFYCINNFFTGFFTTLSVHPLDLTSIYNYE